MFVDSHAHLDSSDFQSDLNEVLERAAAVGVSRILTIGCIGEKLSSVSRVIELVERHEPLFAALGVHPHDARFFSLDRGEEIRKWMIHPKVLGWGEIGLDYHYDHSPRDQQQEAFRSQLRLARAAQKPVIIHCREAEEDLCHILEAEFSTGPGGVLHCFTHSLRTAERCLPYGFYISFGGILTFPKAQELREIAEKLPLDRLLIETDSPYLAPVPLRGKRNEPAFVVKVAEKLAEIRTTSADAIGDLTERNFDRLFFAHRANEQNEQTNKREM